MLRATALAVVFGSCSSPSTSPPPSAPTAPSLSKPNDQAAQENPRDHPFVVLGDLLTRQAQARSGTPDDLPNQLVDRVALAAYHLQFAENYRKGREEQPPNADPLLVSQLEMEEQRHRAEAGKWISLADVTAMEIRALDRSESTIVRVEDYDHGAFCSQWAIGSAADDAGNRLLVEFCGQLHAGFASRAGQLASMPQACEGPASLGGGSLLVALRCQSAPAPAGEPSFAADHEGEVVHSMSPEQGPTIQLALTVVVEPSTSVRAIILTASRSKSDPKQSHLFVSLGEVADASLAMGVSSFACRDVELWRSEKWKATESTKGNQRYTTVLDASFDGDSRTTHATLPAAAMTEFARSRRAGGSYCGLAFELTPDQLERLREFASATYRK